MNSEKKTPLPPTSANSLRVNHFLALAGLCSRRSADGLIAAGRVAVNGHPARPGDKVTPQDELRLDGKTVPWPGLAAQDPAGKPRADFTYILLHKPIEVVSTAKDPQGRRTVLDLLPEDLRQNRLFPVGRLDYFSQGLLILSNDGDLTYRLTHPKWHLPKIYRVLVRGALTESALRVMRAGMTLSDGTELAPVRARELKTTPRGDTWLEMILGQGVNRQIRRMLQDLNLTILKLSRVQQGPLKLGELKPGQWRRLTQQEVEALKTWTPENSPDY